MYKEYNYDLQTKELISISIQNDPLVKTSNEFDVIYNKRTPDGKFIERYISHENGFASTNEDWIVTNTYTRIEGSFEYGCNIKYVRDDGRCYYAQNHIFAINLFPYSNVIEELLENHSNVAEVIYVEKTQGTQIYIIQKLD